MDLLTKTINNREKNVIYTRIVILFAAFMVLMLLVSRNFLHAAVFDYKEHNSIAPVSIPVFEPPPIPPAGATNVGMATLRFNAQTGTTPPIGRIGSVTVRLITDGTFDVSKITSVKIFWDDGDNIFERTADTNVTSGGPYTFSGTPPETTISLNTSDPNNFDDSGFDRFYVVFDFANDADTTANIATNLGCEVISLLYGDNPGPYTTPYDNVSPTDRRHGVKEDFDDYEASVTAIGIAPTPAEGQQGELRVPILKLVFSSTDATLDVPQYSNIDSIRVQRIGSGSDSDFTSGGIILYDDSGTISGSFDAGDTEIPGSAASLIGGYATMNPTLNQPITSTGTTFFVAINIDASAQVGKTIGLRIEDPKNDITFADVIADSYTQLGFIDSSVSTPASGNTVTITELPLVDTTPPTVSFTDPADAEKNVSVNTDITIVFSEEINPATISTSNFTVEDIFNNPVTGTVSASGSSATFTPTSVLAFETIYNVTVAAGVQDLAGNPLAGDYNWSFTTIEDVPEPVAANNRILPGQTEPVKIYIPVPPGGQSEKVTVQIFTVTGEKVVTLVKNRPYSQIAGSLPLEWFGKNSKQKNLGPGLYFIQIKTDSYTKVLKVLIVR